MANFIKGTENNDYTKAMLGNDPELLNSDNDEDITASVIGEGDDRPSRIRKPNITPTEEDDDIPDDEGVEDDVEDMEVTQKPVTKEQMYGKDQVQKIVQTRVNTFTRRVEKLTPYKEAFDRISELTGMDVNQLMARINSMSDQEQAQILGMTPEQVRAARTARQEVMTERGKNQSLSRQLEETQLKTDKRFSDYDLYREEIEELLEENPKLTCKQAYTIVKGDTVTTAAVRDAEQRAINKQVIARQKGIVKPAGASTQKGPKLSPDIVSAAQRTGMDPVEYAQFQSIDNIDAYRAMKARQKGG